MLAPYGATACGPSVARFQSLAPWLIPISVSSTLLVRARGFRASGEGTNHMLAPPIQSLLRRNYVLTFSLSESMFVGFRRRLRALSLHNEPTAVALLLMVKPAMGRNVQVTS